MKILIFFQLFFLITLPYIVFGETNIENNQEIYGKWEKENGPYIIKGKATIPQNRTLVIEKGVIIKLKTGTYNNVNDINFDIGFISVEGNIIVNGTKEEPVIFTRNANSGSWGIIYINSKNPNNTFNYAIIEFANKIENMSKDSSDNRGAVTLVNSMSNFYNCIFRNNNCFGLLLYINSNCNVSYNTFFNNGLGIAKWFNSFINIDNSIFWDNDNTFWGYDDSTFLINHSLIQIKNTEDDYTERVINDMGGNIINVDPLFVNNSCMILNNKSPCIGISSERRTIGAFQN
jgi:hypothetical protein